MGIIALSAAVAAASALVIITLAAVVWVWRARQIGMMRRGRLQEIVACAAQAVDGPHEPPGESV